jgi:hypothetical protein
MTQKHVIGLTSIVIIGLSLILVTPIQLISSNLVFYGVIDDSASFEFGLTTPAPIIELNINADVGNIKIQYTYEQVIYHIKVETFFDLRGANLGGKNHSNIFDINWQTSNSSVDFTLEIKSESWFDNSLWVRKDVDIIIIVKADVTVDINTNLGEGNFELTVPYSTSIRNLYTNISNGNMIYNLEYCLIRGNISCKINKGDVLLNNYDIEFSNCSFWDFHLDEGDLYVGIHQEIEMGENITGTAMIPSGDVRLNYLDHNPNIGAIFSFPQSDWGLGIGQVKDGFDLELFPVLPDTGFLLTSFDYPSKSNYYLTFNVSNFHFVYIQNL